jgi:hypothetical protein
MPTPRANPVRTLLWDIETAPNLAYTWGKWEQNVIAFESEWHVLSIAWKWLGDRSTQVIGLDDFPRFAHDSENDFDLVLRAWQLFDEADIVVAHNGIAFDTKKIQARMLIHGMDPPSAYREVDTLKLARRHFAFTSNRLDDLCRTLDLGDKVATGGFQTWLGCIKGDPAAWRKMKRYNAHDVRLLEALYLKLRPWGTHPNVASIGGVPDACPKCGSTAGMIGNGWRYTSVGRRQRFRCKGCGGSAAGRKIEGLDTKYV